MSEAREARLLKRSLQNKARVIRIQQLEKLNPADPVVEAYRNKEKIRSDRFYKKHPGYNAECSKRLLASDPVRVKRYRDKTREAKAATLREIKSTPCMDCAVRYPYYVMHFDHLPGYAKQFILKAGVTSRRSWDAITDEIAKCELVCANCHAIRTYGRQCLEKFVMPTIENYNLQFGRWSKQLPSCA